MGSRRAAWRSGQRKLLPYWRARNHLRHAALSRWLNAGISPAEVAKRAGNSVEVLLKRYAGCLDNQEAAVNRRIEQALYEDVGDDQDDPGEG